MQTPNIKSDFLLLIAALIWGTTFAVQKMAMDNIPPFIYNALRFLLGAASLLPVILWYDKKEKFTPLQPSKSWPGGLAAGIVLFIAVSLQQIGITRTSVGHAGFITGLYIVFVPLLGIFIGHKIKFSTWAGTIVAFAGMYLLSITETAPAEKTTRDFFMNYGDLLILIGAFFWAGHFIVIDRAVAKTNPLKIACIQFATCSLLSFIAAFLVETFTVAAIIKTIGPILYGGLLSVGIGYSLQVISQKSVPPTHAAIILSLEAVFAALTGWAVFHEKIPPLGLTGCLLMLTGIIIVQLPTKQK